MQSLIRLGLVTVVPGCLSPIASDGLTRLNHEIETYDSGLGKLIAWVQVPSSSAAADNGAAALAGGGKPGSDAERIGRGH